MNTLGTLEYITQHIDVDSESNAGRLEPRISIHC